MHPLQGQGEYAALTPPASVQGVAPGNIVASNTMRIRDRTPFPVPGEITRESSLRARIHKPFRLNYSHPILVIQNQAGRRGAPTPAAALDHPIPPTDGMTMDLSFLS